MEPGNPGARPDGLAALLHQLVTRRQLINNRLVALEHNPALQPPQPQHPFQKVGQPGGGVLIEGQPQLGAIGVDGAPLPQVYNRSLPPGHLRRGRQGQRQATADCSGPPEDSIISDPGWFPRNRRDVRWHIARDPKWQTIVHMCA